MEVQLSKEADRAICEFYKYYLDRRENGESKSSAKVFSNIPQLKEKIFPEVDFEDLMDTICELKNVFSMKMYTDGSFVLSDEAIIYMENRFPNGVKQVLDWLGKIKNIIPFV